MRLENFPASTLPKDVSIGSSQPLALPDKPFVAVLPFQNMSGDPEQEYFADGMVEDITTALFRPLNSRIWSLWAVGAFWRRSLAPCLDDADRLRAAARGRPSRCRADQAIAACGGIARDAVKALLVANEFLEARVAELQAAASRGYSRGRFEPPPRDRKDWYDLSPRSLTTSHCLS
jgi:hypothetical protein